MIVVCKKCISGNEELNSTVEELPKDQSFECYHCKKVIGFSERTSDEPIYVIDELILPPEFVDGLEIDSCQNCGSFSGTELHEYVRGVLESQQFARYYPTLSILFDDDHESFEIPEIECRGCDYPDIGDWLNYVGVSRLPICRFSAKRKSVKLNILENAWFDAGKPQVIYSLDSQTNKLVPNVQLPPDLCAIYSELEIKPNMFFFKDDTEYPYSFCFEEHDRVLLFLETCKSVCGRYVGYTESDEEVLDYTLRPGYIGVFLWIEKQKIIRKDSIEKIKFFQRVINHFLSCREHVYPSEIGIPKFCLDGRPILFRQSHRNPWEVLLYDPPKIEFEQIFDDCEAPEDVVAGLAENESYISISWQLLIDAIAQFRVGRYRESILNVCSAIETEISPKIESWLKAQTFTGFYGDTNSIVLSKNEKDDFKSIIDRIMVDLSNRGRFEIYFHSIAKLALAKFYNLEEQKEILRQLKLMNKKRNEVIHYGKPASADEAINAIYAVGKILRAIHHYDNEQFYTRMNEELQKQIR